MPLAKRVVEVIADRSVGARPRYRYGSGFRLGGRLVLTAAHVVAGAAAAGITVRGPDKVPHPAQVVDGLAGDPDTVDLALLELCDQATELPAPPLAVVDRDGPVPVPVEGCWAVGYPLFQEVSSAAGVVRETAQVWGMILPAENLVGGLLSLQVTSAPRALPPRQEALGQSQWSGMSGAAVCAGERLIGVVSEHAPRRGESTITVTPLANLSRLPATAAARWWAHLAADPGQLIMLPAYRERAEPAYRATLRQLRARTGVLQGRDEELAAIGAFTTGEPSALAPPGSQHAWLVGGPWAGKTALLAEAVHTLPPEVDCVAYFLTRPTGDADRERFLAAVVPQLAWLLDEDSPSLLDEHVFRQLWERAAQRAADQRRQLLLIVDGLDEDLRPGGHSVAGWLPGRLAGLPAQVLVASRLHPGLPDDVDPAHPLAALTPDKLYTLPDSPYAARLRELADQEITQLLRRADEDPALDVLGLLTAASGGPLAAADLATLTGSQPWKVRGVLDGEAARTLRQVGTADAPRYTFAHETLLIRCQEQGVGDPRHARRIHEWAEAWHSAGWPAPGSGEEGTPLYLLDNYPSILTHDPRRLAQLASDVGWVEAATRSAGIDRVLANLRQAVADNPTSTAVAAMLAAVSGQAHNLRRPAPLDQPGYILRQLGMQAGELAEDGLAEDIRSRLKSRPGPCLLPLWTTRQASPALASELGRHSGGVWAMAVLADGRLTTGGGDGRVLVWDVDPNGHRSSHAELGCCHDRVRGMAVLTDGRVVTSGSNGHVLVWDPAVPGHPVELGRYKGSLREAAELPDGRVVTGCLDGPVLVWDPAAPGHDPAELGRHEDSVWDVAVLADGRVISGGEDGRILVWDPAAPGRSPVELARGTGVCTLASLRDGRVITGGKDGRILVWDPAVPGHDPVELARHNGPVWEVAQLADRRLIIGGIDGNVLVWDSAAPGHDLVQLGRHDSSVRTAVALADGWVVTGGDDGRLLVWDPAAAGRDPAAGGYQDMVVKSMVALPGGRVVTGGDDGRVLVWDPAAPGRSPVRLGRHDGSVRTAAVLSDGRRVVTGGDDGRVLVWDPAAPGRGVLVWPGPSKSINRGVPAEPARATPPVLALAALADGRVVTVWHDGHVLLWDPQAEFGSLSKWTDLGHDATSILAVAALGDGRVVTGGYDRSDGLVLVWDPTVPHNDSLPLRGQQGPSPPCPRRGSEIGRHTDFVRAVTALPDGRVVAGGDDGRVLVWNPAVPGGNPAELGRHKGQVYAIAALADGRVVTGGADGRMLIWDPTRPTDVGQVNCSVTTLAAASPGPATSYLIVGHQGGGFSIWSLTG
jgi:WD40 repeat protein